MQQLFDDRGCRRCSEVHVVDVVVVLNGKLRSEAMSLVEIGELFSTINFVIAIVYPVTGTPGMLPPTV